MQQVAFHAAGQQGLVVGDEGLDPGLDKALDDLAAQQRRLAAVAQLGMNQAAHFVVVRQGGLQQGVDLVPVQQIHLQPVFQINDRIAEVVRRLHQVGKRVAAMAAGRQFPEPGGRAHFLEGVRLGQKGAVFARLKATLSGAGRQPRVLQERCQGGVSQAHAIVVLMVFALGEDAETLGIALEVDQVGLLFRREQVQIALAALLEPGADRTLAGVAERRVADVVGQAGRLHDIAQVGGAGPFRQVTEGLQALAGADAQGAAHAGHLQGVGEPVVHMVVGGQWVHLGFARQAPEGAGEDDLVMVAQKGGAAGFILGVAVSQAALVEQLFPVHGLRIRPGAGR